MVNRKSSTPSKQRVLILQGGGSLGAYEAGVFKALYERLYRPNEPLFDIVAGTSIGAINAAILVSYVVKNKGSWQGSSTSLDEFWDHVSTDSFADLPGFRDWWNYWHSFFPHLASGEAARRYYSTKQFGFVGTPAVFRPEFPSVDTRFFDLFNTWYHYDNNPLRKSIQQFAEFPIATDYNKEDPRPRLLVISTDIQECKAVTFDSYPKEKGGIRKTEYGDFNNFNGKHERFDHIIRYDKGVTPDFVVASASVPVTYDYTVIEDVDSASNCGQNYENKRYFWDGGILSNTPIRETLQAHEDYWVNVQGEQNPPDLDVYIIDLYASKQNYIPQDFDGVLNRVSDIEFHDRNIHDMKTSQFIADYIDMTNELTELAKRKGATQQDIDKIMNKEAHSYHRTGKRRMYKDLLVGQFKIENVVRIIRKNDPNTIFAKALDFSSDTIKNLRNEGYNAYP